MRSPEHAPRIDTRRRKNERDVVDASFGGPSLGRTLTRFRSAHTHTVTRSHGGALHMTRRKDERREDARITLAEARRVDGRDTNP